LGWERSGGEMGCSTKDDISWLLPSSAPAKRESLRKIFEGAILLLLFALFAISSASSGSKRITIYLIIRGEEFKNK